MAFPSSTSDSTPIIFSGNWKVIKSTMVDMIENQQITGSQRGTQVQFATLDDCHPVQCTGPCVTTEVTPPGTTVAAPSRGGPEAAGAPARQPPLDARRP